MLSLPYGCSCSDFAVFPANWKMKNASINAEWYIYCRFPDPKFKVIPKYKYGKLVVIKASINRLKTYAERRDAVKALLDAELELLVVKAYNPISKRKQSSRAVLDYGLMPIKEGLSFDYENKQLETHTVEDIRSVLKYFFLAVDAEKIDELPINQIERKHIKLLLDRQAAALHYNPHEYGNYLKALCPWRERASIGLA